METRTVSLERILSNGFAFSRLSISPSFLSKLKELKFEKHKGKEELYVQGESFLPFDHWISEYLRRQLKNTTRDPAILEGLDSMHFVVTKMEQGDKMNMHTDIEVNNSCLFHVCIWFPEKEFEGRDFVYGSKTALRTYHPSFGDCVFINTIDDQFVHGVSRLNSSDCIFSVGGSPSLHTESGAKQEATAIHYGSVEDYLNEFERDKGTGVFIRKDRSE